jgi:hypothetical protein
MAVCVPKKDATIDPTAEVIKASGFCVGVCSPVQAARINTIKIRILVTYFFIRVSERLKPLTAKGTKVTKESSSRI